MNLNMNSTVLKTTTFLLGAGIRQSNAWNECKDIYSSSIYSISRQSM